MQQPERDPNNYPVSACPTGINPGEYTVQFMPTMNKLVDNLTLPRILAVTIATYLNQQIAANRLSQDWLPLNNASVEYHNALLLQSYQALEDAEQARGAGAAQGNSAAHTIPQSDDVQTAIVGSTPVQAVVPEPVAATEQEIQDASLAALTTQPADAAAELAALIAEANGEVSQPAINTTGPVGGAVQQVVQPIVPVQPAFKPPVVQTLAVPAIPTLPAVK